MKVIKGTYIGVRKRLKGKTAHLREHTMFSQISLGLLLG